MKARLLLMGLPPLVLALMLSLTSLAFAQTPQSLDILSLEAGKNPEGIAVNPVTHKAYVVAEVDNPDRQVVMVFDPAHFSDSPKLIEIPDETEYITVDATRNLIYLSTRFGVEEGGDEGGGDEGSGGTDAPLPAQGTVTTLGTLSVIDGDTDTLVESYQFAYGVEPEGVAVDPLRNIVYVGTKAPEPEPENGVCPAGIFFIDRDGDEECWTAGNIVAFNASNITAGPVKTIPAGDDPESVVFANNVVVAANEDDGTVTIATPVKPDGSGGDLLTDTPVYSPTLPPYSLGVFYGLGPDILACPDKVYEADKMAVGLGGAVYITDDKSRVALIRDAEVKRTATISGATQCDLSSGNDENGLNTANNVAFLRKGSKTALLVVSEQNTVAVLNSTTLALKTTITVPNAVHLDAIGVDSNANRIWITDESLMRVFVLQGAGVGVLASARKIHQ